MLKRYQPMSLFKIANIGLYITLLTTDHLTYGIILSIYETSALCRVNTELFDEMIAVLVIEVAITYWYLMYTEIVTTMVTS
jgi:hypothetical protein